MRLLTLSLAVLLLSPSVALAKPDHAGCADHPLFTRMPGMWIYGCRGSPFDAKKFTVPDGKKTKDEEVEGKWTQNIYNFDGEGPAPSELQFKRNYQNAAKAIGGTVLWENKSTTTLLISKDGSEFWVRADKYGGSYTIDIVERAAMKQDVVANAEVFANDLKATGHAAVYGIYFDTGLAVVKPESKPALEEIAKLLKADASLKLRVVGHTDSVGALDANMKLSQARAEAVVKALTSEHGVAAARLLAHGVGPLAPVATNRTDEGRAKNRRVELIEQ